MREFPRIKLIDTELARLRFDCLVQAAKELGEAPWPLWLARADAYLRYALAEHVEDDGVTLVPVAVPRER